MNGFGPIRCHYILILNDLNTLLTAIPNIFTSIKNVFQVFFTEMQLEILID